jgi:predicted amidohydrolase YtcJ
VTTTLFFNGTIRANRGDDLPSWVAIEDDRITEVSPSSSLQPGRRRGAATGGGNERGLPATDRRVDLDGGTLIPAFCDAHVHLPATGLYAGGMDFRGERSAAAILDAFARHAVRPGTVLFGGNFEDPLDKPLTRTDLDSVAGDRPAMLARADLHSCIVSSALLRELDVGDAEGVDRDDAGEPTGYLREQAACGAWSWFETSLPRQDQINAIRSAIDLAYSKGVGSVHEMFVVEWRGWSSYDVLTAAIDPCALNVVTYLGTDEVERVKQLGLGRIGGDYFLDGSFGSHTAWMKEPFDSPPPAGSPPCGIQYRKDDELFDFFVAAQDSGLQVGVHAIGDAAIEQAITTWERVADKAGSAEVRELGHRIEHFECAGDEHIRRAGALGLRPSVQPAFDAYWGGEHGLYSRRIGWERAAQMNRFGTMRRSGLGLGAGSDSTVTPLDPFLQMKALRTHHVAAERLDARAALRAHTLGSHMLSGETSGRGAIEVGAVADLAWLDRDPVTIDPGALEGTRVLGTWVGGARVYPHEEAEAP